MKTAIEHMDDSWWRLVAAFFLLLAPYALIFRDMTLQWWDDPNYSHGFVVPVLSLYFLWRRRAELAEAPASLSPWGLPVLLLAISMLIFGVAGTEYFTMRSSFVVLLCGAVLWLFGWEVLKVAAFPILFLLFAVPLPYIVYDAVAFPLKLLVAQASVGVLNGVGLEVAREGNIIAFPGMALEVADACSGIRSLVSLLALTTAFAFLSVKTPSRRLLLILLAVPAAVVANMGRVIGTGVAAHFLGPQVAEGLLHEVAGFGVFALALGMLAAVGRRL